MQVLERDVNSCPAVLHYVLAADGRHNAPTVMFVKKVVAQEEPADAIELAIVSGPLSQPGAQASAIELAGQHAKAGLRIALCVHEAGDSPGAPESVAALLAAFNAVLITSTKDAASLARRLVRSLIVPADSVRWIGCEWAGVRDLIASTRSKHAHYGFGAANRHGCCADAAEAAYAAATAELAWQGGSLRDAQGVCLAVVTPGPDLAAKDAIALVTRLRYALGSASAIFLSMGCDESLPAGTLEVSLFAFGAFANAEVVPAPSHSTIYKEDSLS